MASTNNLENQLGAATQQSEPGLRFHRKDAENSPPAPGLSLARNDLQVGKPGPGTSCAHSGASGPCARGMLGTYRRPAQSGAILLAGAAPRNVDLHAEAETSKGQLKITLPGVRVCLRWATRPFSVQTEAQTPAQASRHLTLEADGSFGSPWRKAKAAGEIRETHRIGTRVK